MVAPLYGHILDLPPFVDKFRPHRNAILIEMQLAHSTTIIETRQVTRAPRLSLSRNTIMHFQTGKRYKTIRHC